MPQLVTLSKTTLSSTNRNRCHFVGSRQPNWGEKENLVARADPEWQDCLVQLGF